jgi:hypothetical protein
MDFLNLLMLLNIHKLLIPTINSWNFQTSVLKGP